MDKDQTRDALQFLEKDISGKILDVIAEFAAVTDDEIPKTPELFSRCFLNFRRIGNFPPGHPSSYDPETRSLFYSALPSFYQDVIFDRDLLDL